MSRNLDPRFQLAHDLLRTIDSFLAEGDGAARALWDVLSALRGPDQEGAELLKSQTTAVIRTAALPASRVQAERAIRGRTSCLPAEFASFETRILPEERIKEKLPRQAHHFAYHIRYAVVALEELGIKVPQ